MRSDSAIPQVVRGPDGRASRSGQTSAWHSCHVRTVFLPR